MEKEVEPVRKKLDSVGKLFSDAWRLYKRYFLVSLGIIIVPLTIAKLSQIYFGPFSTYPFGWWQQLFSVLVDGFGSIALLFALAQGLGFLESYRQAFRIFWPSLWVGILIYVGIFGGFIMLIVPSVILFVWTLLSLPVFVIEKKRGLSVLAQSGEYAEGYWWAIVGRLLVYLVPLVIIILLFVYFFSHILGDIYAGIFALFVAPFSTALFYELYRNLTTVKPHLPASQPTKYFGFLKTCVIIGTTVIALVVLIRIFYRPPSNDSYFMSQWPHTAADFREASSDFQNAATALTNNDSTSTISDMEAAQSALQDAQTQLNNATRGPLSPGVANFKSLALDTIASGLNMASGTISDVTTGNYTYTENEFMTDVETIKNNESQAQQFFSQWQLTNW